ncbi:GNAT superfamily N-acetyltransferase [Oxalobacteraceae bacterium GrIS 1.11]
MKSDIEVTSMSGGELDFMIELAAAEGWNPGLHDARSFHAADPGGLLIGRVDGRPVACISAVSYGGRFGFIGLYIVAPEWRGHGYGMALWRAAMARLAGQNIGLDGVLAQQDNYRKAGFRLAYSNLRFERTGALPPASATGIVELAQIPFATLAAYDRQLFGADRPAFLRAWIAAPDATALAAFGGAGLQGYGVIRRCRRGYKIGPLFAANAAIAEHLYLALCVRAPDGEPVYLDVPEVNPAALELAGKYAMKAVFGTARMYTGEPPVIPLEQVFGITSFELG